MKQICPVHRFSYSGSVCPFCERERIENLAHRFVKSDNQSNVVQKEETVKEREINENDLQKLMAKFNRK